MSAQKRRSDEATERRGAARRSPRGFTLVELVVVVGIIVVLAAITVAVSVNVIAASEARQTENVIRILDTALTEWQLNADRKISYGVDGLDVYGNNVNGAFYDMKRVTPHRLTIPELFAVVGRNQQVKETLAQIDPQLVHRFDTGDTPPIWITRIGGDPDPNASDAQTIYSSNNLNGAPLDGKLAVLDAWGEPIRIIHPGLAYDPAVDSDGTERTPQEDLYGIAVNRQVCFVSAGPDGRFGDLTQPADSAAYKESDDNLYSYEVIKP